MLGHAALALLSVPPADMHLDAARLRVRESLLHDRVERARRSTTASRTGPAPRSIPFASRVRCLVALGACWRRTALGPGLLAAGPASNSTLLSIVSARASFVVISGSSDGAGQVDLRLQTWTRTVALIKEHHALRAAIAGSTLAPSVYACDRFAVELSRAGFCGDRFS